jgi:RNA polymerase sigma-70 factor (ECF subfamily)
MAGLAVLRAVADRLPHHHRVALVRAELLRRDGQTQLALAAYDEALVECPDGPERRHILTQREALAAGSTTGSTTSATGPGGAGPSARRERC